MELVIGSLVVMVFPIVVVVVTGSLVFPIVVVVVPLVVMVIPLVVTGSLVVPLVVPLVVLFQNVGEAVAGRDCGSCINDVGTGTVKSYGIE